MQNTTINHKPSFKAYIKIKAEPQKIDKLINTVKHKTDDYLFINRKKGKNKDSVCLLTAKHLDIFLDYLKDIRYAHMPDVKKKLSKILGEPPKQKDAQKVIEAVKNNKFNFKTGKIK